MDTKRCIAFGIITVLLLAPAAPVLAAELRKDEEGIPSTAFARLKIGKGTAWVRSGGSADWEERSDSFSRGDSRLARWDRPVERGSVMVRRDGGRPATWEGRGGSSLGAVNGRGTEIPRNGLRPGGSFISRTHDGGAVRGRQANYGTNVDRTTRRESTRPSVVGGGGATGRSGRYSGPVRSSVSSVERAPSSRSGGGSPRDFVTGGSRGGIVGGGSRGFGAGSRGPAGGR